MAVSVGVLWILNERETLMGWRTQSPQRLDGFGEGQ